MPATQSHRHISIDTPLGEDVLLLQSFSFTDTLGKPFQIEAVVRKETGTVDPSTLVGQNATIRLDLGDVGSAPRYFNGYISRFVLSGGAGGMPSYNMTIVPFITLLGRAADCRAYQSKSVPDIVKDLLKERGFTDITDSLTDTYTTREFCVQYRETILNFISRLMQEEGFYFFFTHEDGKHKLALADNRSAHENIGSLKFEKIDDAEGWTIDHWTLEQDARSGGYTLMDYDFTKPKSQLVCTVQSPKSHAQADHEMLDYPGGFTVKADGDRLAKVRLEEAQARFEVAHGTTNCRTLSAGTIFTLTEHPIGSQNTDWLVTSVSLQATSANYSGAQGSSDENQFTCSFTAIPAATQYRPPRTAPEPVIIGPQPAVVVGPAGEEIYTDEYGRVKVIFQWDRYAKADDKASIFIRVAQASAGKNYGTMFLPRVGQEVLVEFSDGDPDRPVVTGVVYNGSNMPPYPLPDKKTRTVIMRSNSSKGGGGANELYFEDDKGNEQVVLHAQYDYLDRCENDRKEYVGKDRHLMVKGDQKESVTGDKHLEVTGDQNEKITGTYSQTVQMDDQHKVSQNYAMDAAMNVHIKAGMNLVLEAGMMITLKAGGAFLTVGPAMVVASGTPVMINSGGSAGSGQGASPESAQKPDEVPKGEKGDKEDAPADRTLTPAGSSTSTPASPAAQVLSQAAESGLPFCEKCAQALGSALGGI